MKFKIIAVAILVAVLGAAYLIFGQEEQQPSFGSSSGSSGVEFSK